MGLRRLPPRQLGLRVPISRLRAMTDHAYCRVYHTIVDDPKFAEVYDNDAALATWLRLLIIADQAWPSSGQLPGNTRRRTFDLLARVGLVDPQPGWRFRIHGLDAERGRRKDAARVGGLASGRSRSVERPLNDRSPTERTETNLAEQSRAEQSRAVRAPEGWPHLDAAAAAAIEERTGQPWSLAGDKQLAELDRLIGQHGAARVFAALDAVSDGKRMTARQLVWPALRILEPFPDPKATQRATSEQREAEAGRRRVQQTKRRIHDLGAHADERDPMCDACTGRAA